MEIVPNPAACNWGTRYSCVIGYGRATFVEDERDKAAALDVILRHCDPQTTYRHPAEKPRAVSVFRAAIESMTGKRSE